MLLQGAVRERRRSREVALAEECHGASREAWSSPRNAAPDRPCLLCQSVEPETIHERSRVGWRPSRVGCALVTEVNLSYPRGKDRGAAQRGRGQESNTPPPACCWSLPGRTGRLREGWEGEWVVGKGAPNETPKPARRVGWGRGVGARESRAHQDEDGWRRPLACAKRETQVPSARASCPRVDACGTGDMGTDASWIFMENDHRC